MHISSNFELFIGAFSRSHQLFDDQSKVLVATSAGVDSITLLEILSRFKNINLSILHFNHGTRVENDREEKLVKKIANKKGIELFIHRFNFELNQPNFEFMARKSRQEIYQHYIKNGYVVATAHHLDDSFEWSLMQKFKQSSIKSSLGIPLVSNGIIRPFMCVSKKQIILYAKENSLEWIEDKSNENVKYERNNIRHNIIPQIKKRYPQYLKHYVYQQNELADTLGIHRLSGIKKKRPLLQVNHFISGVVLHSKFLELYRKEILDCIHRLSKSRRGKLSIIIDQVFSCVKKIRLDPREKKFHGPFYFSGDVVAYLFVDRLYLVNKYELEKFKDFDSEVTRQLRDGAEITLDFINNPKLEYFPNLFIKNAKTRLSKNSKLSNVFFYQTLDYLKRSHIPYSFGPLEESH